MYVQKWKGGVLGTTHWTSDAKVRSDTLKPFTDPDIMWYTAAAFVHKHGRHVLFAYDLATQMRVSQALVCLPALGFRLDKIVLERTSAWARFVKDDASLLLCDVKSWAPVEFCKLAADVGFVSPESRSFDTGGNYSRDVAMWRAGVIRDAVLQIMEWIEGENLGPFRPTGSGQSYSAFRRRFLKHRILVHDDVERIEYERAAMWTGRCEAWRHGTLTGGPYVEYDMTAAYCNIGAQCDVPTLAVPRRMRPNARRMFGYLDKYAVLAHVTITTHVPIVPTRMGGRTVWPVGTFSTWLWDPELRIVEQYAHKVECHAAYLYHREPAIADFCRWVLDGLSPQTQVYGLVPRRVLKHWSRCLVGRLGLRYRGWEPFGTSPESDLRLVTYIDVDEGTSTDLLQAGHDRFILSDMTEAMDSLPQIPGWVMSECRRRLWTAMSECGLNNVVYVDTDSIILGPGRRSDAAWERAVREPGAWSIKGTYSRVTIHGPRNLVCESDRRISGVPLTARQVAPLEFSGQVMRSVKESMRAGELDRVTQIPRRFVLDAPDLRRQHMPDGTTEPYIVRPQSQPEE
jgi:hypothetical protein